MIFAQMNCFSEAFFGNDTKWAWGVLSIPLVMHSD
jgi:hypothetical protein